MTVKRMSTTRTPPLAKLLKWLHILDTLQITCCLPCRQHPHPRCRQRTEDGLAHPGLWQYFFQSSWNGRRRKQSGQQRNILWCWSSESSFLTSQNLFVISHYLSTISHNPNCDLIIFTFTVRRWTSHWACRTIREDDCRVFSESILLMSPNLFVTSQYIFGILHDLICEITNCFCHLLFLRSRAAAQSKAPLRRLNQPRRRSPRLQWVILIHVNLFIYHITFFVGYFTWYYLWHQRGCITAWLGGHFLMRWWRNVANWSGSRVKLKASLRGKGTFQTNWWLQPWSGVSPRTPTCLGNANYVKWILPLVELLEQYWGSFPPPPTGIPMLSR